LGVIPITSNSFFDCDLTKITANETLLRGMANLWNENQEGPYGVRHGYRAVSDFPSQTSGGEPSKASNLFEKAFPSLYPYGEGGIEANRPVLVSFKHHVQWSLQYFDRRFRRHETFSFFCFGVLQRREALLSARLQMNRKAFDQDAQVLSTLSKEKMATAVREEQENQPTSDPAVRLVWRSVRGALSHIMGSNESCCQLRSQIWSTSVVLGPPTIWLTINPSDMNNPIAQFFAGEQLSPAWSTAAIDKASRARNVAEDPYAAANFFHFLIRTILDKLFRVKIDSQGHCVQTELGIMGRVQAYYGLVESQG
jgi:hypothetical protein